MFSRTLLTSMEFEGWRRNLFPLPGSVPQLAQGAAKLMPLKNSLQWIEQRGMHPQSDDYICHNWVHSATDQLFLLLLRSLILFVMQSGMAHTLLAALCCNFFTHLGVYSLKCTPRLISSPQARQIQFVSDTPEASLWRRLTSLGFQFTECA